MSILSCLRDMDESIRVLDNWLRERDYTRRSRERIAIHVRAEGELSGAVPEYLDREDLDVATEILVEAMPPVPHSSPEWGEDDARWNPADAYQIVPPELEDDLLPGEFPEYSPDAPDHAVTTRPGYWEALAADGIDRLPAICGGSPESDADADAPFEPDASDWRDYQMWSESLAVKRWLAENPSFAEWHAANGGHAAV